MIKKLAGLLLAISTTASAQFVVQDEVEYNFMSYKKVALSGSLQVGDIVYLDNLSLCLDSKNRLSLMNMNFYPIQDASSKFKITLIEENEVSITSLLEQERFLLHGPAFSVLEKLKDNEKTRGHCNWDEEDFARLPSYKVDNLFGYTSYNSLAEGIIKDLKSQFNGNFDAFKLHKLIPLTPE